MKKMKKLLSMLLAVVMVLAMAAPSFATEAGKGKITITNATAEKSYSIYKVFSATLGSTNVDGKKPISYTATSAQKIWFESLEAKNPFLFTATSDADVFYVSAEDEDKVTTFLQEYVKTNDNNEIVVDPDLVAHMASATPKTERATSETLVFDNVDYGYYLVTSSMGAIITLDSANPEVKLIDKNQSGPTWPQDGGKKILSVDGKKTNISADKTNASANFGDTINYEVKFNTTNYDGEKIITYYYLKDTLAKGMSYVMQDNNTKKVAVQVKVGDQVAKDVEIGDLDPDENSFEITIPWYNKDNKNFIQDSKSADTITITYSAIVNTDAVIAGTGNTNTANFKYDKFDPENPGNSDEQEEYKEVNNKTATIYTYALVINKTNKDGVGLSGAIFELEDSSNNKIYMNTTFTTDANGNSVYLCEKVVETPTNEQDTKVTSPSNGVIIIKGVAEGKYKLTEVMAPEGYNLLTETKEITAVRDSSIETKTEITTYYDENGDISKTETTDSKTVTTEIPFQAGSIANVVNIAGTLLPSTGGIGTTIFYAAGIILMAGAVFFVVRRKRA